MADNNSLNFSVDPVSAKLVRDFINVSISLSWLILLLLYNSIDNIKNELNFLNNQASNINVKDQNSLSQNINKLQSINEELWDIENHKRECEANKDFGEKFIQLSRDVHFKNDIRAQIKKKINLLTDSIIVEEKEYSKY